LQQALAKAQPEILKIGGLDPQYDANHWNAWNKAGAAGALGVANGGGGVGVTVTSATAGSTSYAYNSLVRQ
jgi:hypothetical protein